MGDSDAGSGEGSRRPRPAHAAGGPGFLHGYLIQAANHAIHAVPVLVSLLAVTMLLELNHADPIGDEILARWVAKVQKPVDVDDGVGLPASAVVLEITAPAGVLRLEHEVTALPAAVEGRLARTLDRTNGIRPFDRARLAALLAGLADRLERRERGGASPFEVIAIDMDLAPLDGSSVEEDRQAMLDAVAALRRLATVIVVAPDRSPEPRTIRSAFMRDAGCARQDGALAYEVVGHGGPRPLYFASPLVFKRLHGAPFTFPGQRKDSASLKTVAEQEVPPWFPSLGVAIYLALSPGQHTSGHVVDSADRRKSLTALCEQAHRDVAGQTMGVDEIDPASVAAMRAESKRFTPLMYNWRIAGRAPVERTTLGVAEVTALQGDPAGRAVGPGLDLPPARALVFGAAGTGTTDRHDIPFFPGGADAVITGANLHAIAARSMALPVRVTWVAPLVADLAIGLVFVAALSLVAPASRSLFPAAPLAQATCFAATTLLLTGGLLCFAVRVAASALDRGYWINPSYILVGLALHAYLTGWESANKSHDVARHLHWTPLQFGLVRWSDAFARSIEKTSIGVLLEATIGPALLVLPPLALLFYAIYQLVGG